MATSNNKSSSKCSGAPGQSQPRCGNVAKSTPGYQASAWGPGLWFFLHVMARNYPPHPTPADKHNVQLFLESLVRVLPCQDCSKHFEKYMTDRETALGDRHLLNREALSRWLFDFHNAVNKRIGKPKLTNPKQTFAAFDAYRSDGPVAYNSVLTMCQRNAAADSSSSSHKSAKKSAACSAFDAAAAAPGARVGARGAVSR